MTEAEGIYRSLGTLGAHANTFNHALVSRLVEAQQHAAGCEELYDAVRKAAGNGGFCAGDYMVYFTLAFHLRKIDFAIILRAMNEAVRLATTPEFGLAWDLVQVVALALSMGDQLPSNEEIVLLLGQLLATVLTFPIPTSLERELPANIAAVLGQLPPYMAVAIFNATARGLREARPRYNVLAWVAHHKLSAHLSPTERVTFIIVHWLPSLDPSTESQHILNQVMNSAIVAIEDAHPAAEEVDSLLPLLLDQLAKYPLRARLEFSRHLVRLAVRLAASRKVLAFAHIQHANWLASLDRTEAGYELRRARELWPVGEMPRDAEANVLFLETALAFQRGEHTEALLLADQAVDRASVDPKLLTYAESRRNTLRVMVGLQLESAPTAAAPNYMELVSRLYAEAVAALRHDQLPRCIQMVGEALALPRPAVVSEAQYTRRRAYLLRAAAQLRAGNLEASLGSVLDAIDELTEGIRRHISGTEQAARRDRFAEVEALLDRCLQIVSQDPQAFGWTSIERLWESLVHYRDIDLEFSDSIRRLHRTGAEGPVADYRQTRDLLAALELDGCAKVAGRSDAAMMAQYARLMVAVQHRLYNIEIILSDMPSYADSVLQRLGIRLGDVLAELRDDELLVEFVGFWSGIMVNGAGLRSIMGLMTSATEPERFVVIADRRTRPPQEVVVQSLLDLDQQPSESVDLPIGEVDLAKALMQLAQETRATRLLCVPDGPVKLVNLAALSYADGRLADYLDIAYLGHAVDLLLHPSLDVSGPSAVLGDADYDLPLSQSRDVCVSDGRPPLQFPELPATAAEAAWVGARLRALPITRDRATAASLRAMRSPLVLHIATHGLFDEGQARASLGPTGRHDRAVQLRVTAACPRLSPDRPMDPALRSGVALAGINWWLRGLPGGDEDSERGYVSAYDISWMDLTGTRLAVFSGCRTGRGPDERYLGLVDLRRAVRTAGASEVIVAIWNVPDVASALLMHLFYLCASYTVPTGEDLGRAQGILRHATVADIRSWLAEWSVPPTFGGPYLREILQQPNDLRPFADPYYWAGFVCYTTGRARQPMRKDLDGSRPNEHQSAHV